MQIISLIRISTISCLFTPFSLALPNVRHVSANADKQRETTVTVAKKDNSRDSPVVVMLNLQQSLNTVTDHFVGVNIDMAMVRANWRTLDFSSKKVQNMARALTPTFFRLGGGSADSVTYDLRTGHQRDSLPTSNKNNFTMTAEQWIGVNEFVKTVGWDFIFDVNELKRNSDGSWNSTNARQLLQFSAARNYTIVGFEMGNEYDIFENKFHLEISPAQLVKDVMALRGLLGEFPLYSTSFILGPETATSSQEYFQGFLAAGGYQTVRAASFHHYYFKGSEGTLSNFTDMKVMDSLADRIDYVWNQSRSVDPQLPLWLSETSSAFGGGSPGLSDRFAAGFLWLDKLGMCASKGIQTVLRQDFYGGSYPLINSGLNPNPDFWLTVLYKRIVRGPVFNTTGRTDVRVYAACANTDNFPVGSPVVYTLNPNSYSVTFDLFQFQNLPRLVYSLTPAGGDGLLSKYISLNDVELVLVNDELPDLKPATEPPGYTTVAPYSFTFFVVPDARISICQH